MGKIWNTINRVLGAKEASPEALADLEEHQKPATKAVDLEENSSQEEDSPQKEIVNHRFLLEKPSPSFGRTPPSFKKGK
jgi:hypothetical protein